MKVSPATPETIREAARAIRAGGVVVVPTETVYGLGADALNPAAVARIFEIKGRPLDNPLIVHVATVEQARTLVAAWPKEASLLTAGFWPGPLTLVLPKAAFVPSVTTAGLDTVAVRMPAHPVMQALIAEAKTPIAAPSANPFMGLSPTRVEHLDPELASEADLILDGGPCEVGLESTVIDVSGPAPRLLRPGMIGREAIERTLGQSIEAGGEGGHKSPGSYPRHYSPRTPLKVVRDLGERPGLTFGSVRGAHQIQMPAEPEAYAAALYNALHTLDRLGLDRIYAEETPEGPQWSAPRDRLAKAAGG